MGFGSKLDKTERKGIMKTKMAIISLLFGASSAWATLITDTSITDNFDRADTSQTSYTVNVGGTGWTQVGDGTSGADWFINTNQLRGRPRASSQVMYNTGLQTTSGDDTSFTLSADVSVRNVNNWGGIAFNYTDANNYYFIRYKAGTNEYQVLEMSGGSQIVHVNKKLSEGTFAAGGWQTITVTSTGAGVFDFEIGTAVSGSVDDSASARSGGYAGLWVTGTTSDNSTWFDNFSLSVIPEPATIGLFGVATGVILVIRRKIV